MKRTAVRSILTISCVCIFLILMCAFFVDDAHAAQITSGKTTAKEQTIRVSLKAGTCLITVQDADSWVFAQLQTTGNNRIGRAIDGDRLLANLGQRKTVTVPVRKAGTYYVYLHGVNAGASYKIQHIPPTGTLTSGKPRIGTSYGDNKSISYYKIDVPASGALKVTVKDASFRYPGYSKVQLKRGSSTVSGDEHLIRGLGYTTIYGVTRGTYYIGVRSSSELYKLTAKFARANVAAYGVKKKQAAKVARNTSATGVIEPGNKTVRWYRIDLPARSAKAPRRNIHIRSANNNRNLNGGTVFTFYFKRTVNGKLKTVKERHLLNCSDEYCSFGTWKKKVRTVYVRVASAGGATGTYSVSWK